jgi:hypothetical protein
MPKKKVISRQNIKPNPPTYSTLTLWLVLKVTEAPEWVWGAVGLLVVAVWIMWIYDSVTNAHEEVDIFNDDKK